MTSDPDVATYVLIHGAASDSWYWHLVEPELRGMGHEVVTPDLPCDDDTAGLAEYADAVVDAIGDRADGLVLVAQSLAGFTAPLVCERLPVELLVLVAAMVPRRASRRASGGRTPVGSRRAASRPRGTAGARATSSTPSRSSSTTSRPTWWPSRCTTSETSQRLRSRSRGRSPPGRTSRRDSCCAATTASSPPSSSAGSFGSASGITPDEMDGGHLPALSRPRELAERLDALARR